MKKTYRQILSFLVSLLTPVALIGLALRILLTPYAVQYLVNNADISYLGDLKFEDGRPLYGQRELTHMEDVKNVVSGALRLWYASLLILTGIALLAWRGEWMPVYLNGLRRGGWWMVGLAVALAGIAGLGIAVNPDIFWQFFIFFHGLFFEGNSWLFLYSDTLIRLFPIRFWQDAFLWAAVIALGGGLGLALGLKRFRM
jgi:integral membrane protein (TIGR01906 family)